MVIDEIAAVEAAGLRVEAVDSLSLALLRVAADPKGSSGPGGLEAIIGIGADLITVAVRDGGVPRFVRTVALPGSPSKQTANDPLMTPASSSERGSRTALRTGPSVAAPERLEAIVGEVRSSLEYLLSQSEIGSFERVLLTGGGAMLPGVGEALSAAIGLPVGLASLRLELDEKGLGLDSEALQEASYRWLSAVGLALWGVDSQANASLLPAEVSAKRRQRRIVFAAIAGVAAVALVLAGVSVSEVRSADSVSNQIRISKAEAVALQQKISKLGYVLEIPAEVQSRRALASDALYGDIAWTAFLQRLKAALPSSVQVQTIAMTKSEATSTSGAAPTIVPPGSVIGAIAMNAETTGGAPGVAQFIDKVSKVKGIFALWVSSTTKSPTETSIQASALVTTAAFSTRAANLPGGSK